MTEPPSDDAARRNPLMRAFAGERLARLLREHSSLSATGTLFLLFALHIVVESHGNSATARVLVSGSSLAPSMVNLLISTLPVVVGIVFLLFGLSFVDRLRAPQSGPPGWGFLIVIGLLAFATVQWAAFVAEVAFLVAAGACLPLRSLLNNRAVVPFVWLLIVLFFAYQLIGSLDEFDVARTKFTVGGPRTTYIVGYEVGQTDRNSIIVRESDRHVLYVPTSEIAKRQLCSSPSGRPYQPLIIEWFASSAPSYPRC